MKILSQHRCLFVVERWEAASAVVLSALFLSAVLVTAPIVKAQVAETPKEHTLTVLHDFSSSSDGADPFNAALIQDSAGNLYGTTEAGGSSSLGTVFEVTADGVEKVLYSFTYGTDGFAPIGGLVQDETGDFYGTTQNGGDMTKCNGGCGVVYKLDAGGHYSVLHKFTKSDGATPSGTLLLDSSGNLYGTTLTYGYSSSGCCGTAYKLSPNGVFTVLHKFTGGRGDGAEPNGGLIQDPSGNLYGTTKYGGGGSFPSCHQNGPPPGCGTIFKIDTAGQETVLHRFVTFSDGTNPWDAGVLMDSQGNLYGTTRWGGVAKCNIDGFGPGCGTVYKLDKTGKLTPLHAFHGRDGGTSAAPLIMNAAGHLYGTTVLGGLYRTGTVFEADSTKAGPLIWEFSFTRDGAEPWNPSSALLWGADGNLYGTSFDGGGWNAGTVFKLTP